MRSAAGIVALLLIAQPACADDAASRQKLARSLLISGEVVLAAAYTTSAAISFAIGVSCSAEPGDPLCQKSRFLWGALPVAGPWVQLKIASCRSPGRRES